MWICTCALQIMGLLLRCSYYLHSVALLVASIRWWLLFKGSYYLCSAYALLADFFNDRYCSFNQGYIAKYLLKHFFSHKHVQNWFTWFLFGHTRSVIVSLHKHTTKRESYVIMISCNNYYNMRTWLHGKIHLPTMNYCRAHLSVHPKQ